MSHGRSILLRIGHNQVTAIPTALGYLEAQMADFAETGTRAQRRVGSPGKRDGLCWPAAGDRPSGPLVENGRDRRRHAALRSRCRLVPRRYRAMIMHPLRILAALCLVAVTACSGPNRIGAVPRGLADQATVLDIPNARFWADTQGPDLIKEAMDALARERATLGVTGPASSMPPANFLSLSGGSDNGAFGAGLLVGWTAAGTRPSFKIVTGVSTGALIAPLAFLGPDYDPQLRDVYTAIKPRDIFESRGLLLALFYDALNTTDPLYRLISRYADEKLLAAVAREYAKGRLLLIGTTNLDMQRPVIWNMGAIASSGKPGALELFRKVLLASAAVPGAFPAVMFDVEINGRHYQEMHVDGGAVMQTFLIPPQVGVLVDMRGQQHVRERHAYVIRNGRLDPEWADTQRSLLSITGRAISTMIHYSGYNDIVRIYGTSLRDGVDFNLAYIGSDFATKHTDMFETSYMRALFDYGYRQARSGYPWHKTPPVYSQPDGEERLLAQTPPSAPE
ncbi:MAG: DUF2950 family protein [Rhodospirillales bacterium]|nr:DUF2950 family protein [Rhodospirillales bacterium]